MADVPELLYHWSPTGRRASITRRGLVPRSRPACGAGLLADEPTWRAPYVCLGPDPRTAWCYSGAIFAEVGETWDLWLCAVLPADDVRKRDDAPEYRVWTRLPKSRVWLVGTREVVTRRGPNR